MSEPIRPREGYTFAGARPCTGCRALIYWWITTAGKRSPHDADGTSHFATCPQRDRFRRPPPPPQMDFDSLFAPDPPSTADEHSQEAAERIEPVAGTKRAIVLAALRSEPAAEWQLERQLHWPGNTVRPRLWELEKMGLIEKHGSIPTPAGRSAWVYRVVDEP